MFHDYDDYILCSKLAIDNGEWTNERTKNGRKEVIYPSAAMHFLRVRCLFFVRVILVNFCIHLVLHDLIIIMKLLPWWNLFELVHPSFLHDMHFFHEPRVSCERMMSHLELEWIPREHNSQCKIYSNSPYDNPIFRCFCESKLEGKHPYTGT